MEKAIFKVFFSKSKENDWLNSLGKQGYLLTKISDSRYFFTVSEDKVYSYSIEYLNCSPNSSSAEEYMLGRKEQGIYPIITGKNWMYFASECTDINTDAEVHKKNSIFYFWRWLYSLLLSVLGAVVIGYQAFASRFILEVGHTGNGHIKITEVSGNSFGDAFAKMWNGILSFIDKTYLELFRNIFGESDAVFVLAVAVPLVIISSVYFTFNFDEYLIQRKLAKKCELPSNEIEVEQNAE